ncbi:hypothetical protein BDU57DRAFT_588186 [Ampelomyces quisqualis]|uniref:SET domain-containing protein n=1 Tax=Ampelomyces quisqualis TaxID=50730 RepID=A0A6A5QI71_AMPQU|nr:hypothetical protein BDU57DRAFT_588186 [Ampelomyces quisqualis]
MYAPVLSLVSTFVLASLTDAKTVLDRQCWHEYPLVTAHISSSTDRTKEYAFVIQDSIHRITEFGAPWTHPPKCTLILRNINDKLCVYTSTSFANGRGISIITTPTIAKQYAGLPAFTDQSALNAQQINEPTYTWRASTILNKGIGMLATKPLVFADRVTSYTPAFLALLEDELTTHEREKWWRLAIEQLPAQTKEEFLGLAYVFGDERFRVQDIVQANTFQVEIGGRNHLAVWPETSRLNHACNPNAQYIINTDMLSHTVRATRPIAEGEEITISYTSPLDPYSVRQNHLRPSFRFKCACSRCTSHTSDDTLSLIHSLQAQLNDWSASSTGSPEMAEQLLQLHREEGLEGFMDVAYGFAALAYSAVGDETGAVKYAEKAKEAILMKDGMWSANLRIWEELLMNVKAHWSWRRRE